MLSCPVCGERGETVSGEFDGYIEGYRVRILECPRCTLRYGNRRDVPDRLYEAIYQHVAALPGYSRYARYASAVTRHPHPLDLLAAEELPYAFVRDRVRHGLAPGGTVVDLGCGEGYLTYALRRAGVACVGVDVSTTTVQRARRRFGHDDWFLTSDEFAGQGRHSADLVIATELIEHVPDPVRLVRDVKEMLTKGGSLLLTTPNRDASPADSVWDTDLPPVHLLWFGTASIRELATQTGCQVAFPAPPEGAPSPLPNRSGTWPPLLRADGTPSTAVRQARSVPWRGRRRLARALRQVSHVLERSPFRNIPPLDRSHPPATLAALLTPRPLRGGGDGAR